MAGCGRPQPPADIIFWCVLVPAGAPHMMSGNPTERAFPPRAEILAEMLRTRAGDRRPPGELKPVKHSRTWIVSVSLSPPVLLTVFCWTVGMMEIGEVPGPKRRSREENQRLVVEFEATERRNAYPPVSLSIEISWPSSSLTRTLSFSPSNVRVHRSAGFPCPRISLSITNVWSSCQVPLTALTP
jgi:hypothetical protein